MFIIIINFNINLWEADVMCEIKKTVVKLLTDKTTAFGYPLFCFGQVSGYFFG